MTEPNVPNFLEALIQQHLCLMEQYEKACKAEIEALDELRRARTRTNDAEQIEFLLRDVLQASSIVKSVEERLKSLVSCVNEPDGKS